MNKFSAKAAVITNGRGGIGVSSDSIKNARQRTNEFFASTVVKGRNFVAIDKVYTLDACILPPGADLIEGRENIRRFWEVAVTSLDVQNAKPVSVNAHQSGDSIIEIGAAELSCPGGHRLP